jgi:hypothetical protein
MERKTFWIILRGRRGLLPSNTEPDRQSIEKIKSGEIMLSGIKMTTAETINMEEPLLIFALYEENIACLPR